MASQRNIFKQRRVKPYQANGKTTFNLQGLPGVYLIYVNDLIDYIGYSGTNLYKTLYRHFQRWNDKSQIRVTYSKQQLKNVTVRVVYTRTAAHAFKLEKALINKYKPAANPTQYESYEPTKGDIAKLDEYLASQTNPIAEFYGDVPF